MSRDPYYLVREEIQESLTGLEKSYDRLDALPLGIPEHNRLRNEVHEGCESVSWQVDQLQRAIDISAKNPERFKLDQQELDSRQRWAAGARKKIEEIRRGLAAIARKMPTAADSASAAAHRQNEDFINHQAQLQQQIMRQQDVELDELGHHVAQIGQIGLTIHEELEAQNQLLEELEEDMDTTQNRLAAVQKKINQVLQRLSSKTQTIILIVLVIILLVLVALLFL